MSIPNGNEFDPIDAMASFEVVNEYLPLIEEQNQRHDESFELGDEEFETLVREGVAEEQHVTMDALAEASAQAPYEQLAAQSLTVDRVLGSLAAMNAPLQAKLAAEQLKIDAFADKAARLSPASEPRIRQLADERKAKAYADIYAESSRQEESLQAIRAEIDALYETAGQPWPIPRAMPRITVGPETITVGDDELEAQANVIETADYIDEMPVEPVLSEHAQAVLREIREHHVDAPQATQYIALYMGEHCGKVVTVEELAAFVYKESVNEAIGEQAMRSRITTLLGPAVHGQRTSAILSDRSMVLQYGWRRYYNPDGGLSPRQRVYRAVSTDDLGAAHKETVTHNTYVDSMDPVSDTSQLVTPPEVIRLAEEPAHEPTPTHEHEPIQTDQESETLSHENATEATAGTEPEHTLQGEADAENALPMTILSPLLGKAEKRADKNEWQREFRTRVGNATEELAKDELINPGTVTARMVGRLSSSDKLGTNESVDRMVRAKILPRTANTDPAKTLLTAKEIVAMYMLNTEPALSLNDRRKQKAALRLIDDCVKSYLDKQDEA